MGETVEARYTSVAAGDAAALRYLGPLEHLIGAVVHLVTVDCYYYVVPPWPPARHPLFRQRSNGGYDPEAPLGTTSSAVAALLAALHQRERLI